MSADFAARLSPGQELAAYRVRAVNDAALSENKIHDDAVARQYGFRGGLVPGVTVYAYMVHPVVEALGIDWLEHGAMSARFLKPVYEGEEADVTCRVASVSSSDVTLELTATSAGELCAVGSASLTAPFPDPPAPDAVAPAPARSGDRPAAGEASLAVGTVLGSLDEIFRQEPDHREYLDLIGERLDVFRAAGGVAHPGYLMRRANSILVENVRLGPWIHVSSEVAHFGLLHDGDHLQTRAVVTDLFERKGHRFVDLDVLMLANGNRPVMRVAHRAIYEVRKISD